MGSPLPERRALFAGTFAVYAATATPGAFLLDSSELAGAAVTLGVPHAPGHPLYVLLGHAAALAPLGPVGWRVALLSALLGALAVVLVFDLARAWSDDGPRWPAVLAAALFAAGEPLWLQSVRAEVYTLQLVAALWLLVVATRWARSPAPRSVGEIVAACFVVGLAAGNHHLLVVALLPALALLLFGDGPGRRAALRALPAAVPAGVAGVAVYATLPLMAAGAPLINYGDPSTASRLLDVVMARVFVPSVASASTPLADNLPAAAGMMVDAVGPALLAAAVGGWLLLLRSSRLLAGSVALAVAGNLATKVVMDLDATNPDAHGYFLLSGAVLAALAAHALAVGAARADAWRPAAALVGVLAVAWAAVALPARVDRTDLSAHRGPAVLDTALEQHVLPDALLLTSFFALHFDRLYHQAVEGHRPDVLTSHMGFEDHVDGGRPHTAALAARDPRLAPIAAAYAGAGPATWPAAEVLALADVRPVYVEPTLALPLPPERLEYAGGLLRVLPSGLAPRPRVAAQRTDQAALLTALGDEASGQREVRATLQLTWLQLAVSRLHQGSGAGALAALALVTTVSPGNRWAARLSPLAEGLARLERDGPADRLAAARARLRATDFTGLFR